MKNGLRSVLVVAGVMFLSSFLETCTTQSVETSTPATLVSITIKPTTAAIAPGTTLQMEAVGTYSNFSAVNVTSLAAWDSSDHGVATVSSTGLATADPAGSGSTTITATVGTITGSALLTSSPLSSIAVTPADQSIAPGTTLQLFATGTLQNLATQDLSRFAAWDSSDKSVAAVGGTGLATATAATGMTTITATFDAITGSAELITAAVTSIGVTPADPIIALGTTQQFTATGTLSNATTQNLTSFATWTSSPTGIAAINSSGLAASVSQGTAAISATFGSVSDSTTLTVTAPSLVSIAVTPASQSIALGLTQQFKAVGTFSDGSMPDITADVSWKSSDTTIATISNVAATAGLATSLAQGTTNISASLSGITSNQAPLTVTQPVLVSITVTPSNPFVTFAVTSVPFTATGEFSNGTKSVMTSAVTWSSSNAAVAFISNAPGFQGVATPFGVGATTISAASGTVTGSTVLTVSF